MVDARSILADCFDRAPKSLLGFEGKVVALDVKEDPSCEPEEEACVSLGVVLLGRQPIDFSHSPLFCRALQEYLRVEDDSGAPREHTAISFEDKCLVELEVEEDFGLGVQDSLLDG